MKTFRQYFGILIAGLLLFFLLKPLVQTHASLKTATFQVQWLIFSFFLILFYSSVYLYPFATLLSGITQKQVPFRSAWMLFHLANITRYLPGRIWRFVRLLSLSKRFGLSKTAVGAVSLCTWALKRCSVDFSVCLCFFLSRCGIPDSGHF